jgi:membrane protease YdiL (CAAX protease family)
MSKSRFSLIEHPWLFLLVFIFATFVCFFLAGMFLQEVFGLSQYSSVTSTWTMFLGNILLLFIVVPFILGFPKRSHPYETYLSEIRLTHVKPLLRLILLGVSCYLILAVCTVAGVLIYRLTQGLPVNISFMRYSFIISKELPPHSMSWLYTLPSILEEVAFRGVVLAMFLRFYNQPKAILFSALGFGIVHLGNILSGGDPIWVAGQVIWAAILGLFYGYVTLKTNSLLPAMILHYLSNLFVPALNGYIQTNAAIPEQALYGIIFTFGAVPTILMILWVRGYTTWLKMVPATTQSTYAN